MNKREIGKINEDKAVEYLEKNSYQIIDRNFFSRIGEIDIIARNENYLCFIEVKYREKHGLIKGYEAVNRIKQKTIYNVAKVYMLQKKIKSDTACRFDVVSIDGDDITLIKNAFP